VNFNKTVTLVSRGICTSCKFFPEIGSLNPFFIEILDIEWGDFSHDIVQNPSVLTTDVQDNWSNVEISNTFQISFTDTTVDTTTWERSWGFEFSTTLTTTFSIGIVSASVEITATTKYDGKKGGSNAVTDSTTYDKSATYPCPPKHRCEFKLMGRRLNDAAIPFTATVQKTDGSKVKTWKENGVWKGVKVYDTYTEYRTQPL